VVVGKQSTVLSQKGSRGAALQCMQAAIKLGDGTALAALHMPARHWSLCFPEQRVGYSRLWAMDAWTDAREKMEFSLGPCPRRMATSLPQQRLAQVLRRAFRYDWRLWTIPDVREAMQEAGFDASHVWLRPMKSTSILEPAAERLGRSSALAGRRGSADLAGPWGADDGEPAPELGESGSLREVADDDDGGAGEAEEYREYAGPAGWGVGGLEPLGGGWTAYVVGVVDPCPSEGSMSS
jgi:hypothetical protein